MLPPSGDPQRRARLCSRLYESAPRCRSRTLRKRKIRSMTVAANVPVGPRPRRRHRAAPSPRRAVPAGSAERRRNRPRAVEKRRSEAAERKANDLVRLSSHQQPRRDNRLGCRRQRVVVRQQAAVTDLGEGAVGGGADEAGAAGWRCGARAVLVCAPAAAARRQGAREDKGAQGGTARFGEWLAQGSQRMRRQRRVWEGCCAHCRWRCAARGSQGAGRRHGASRTYSSAAGRPPSARCPQTYPRPAAWHAHSSGIRVGSQAESSEDGRVQVVVSTGWRGWRGRRLKCRGAGAGSERGRGSRGRGRAGRAPRRDRSAGTTRTAS